MDEAHQDEPKSYKLSAANYKLLKESLEKCGDQVDMAGWRYSKDLGYETYIPIDIDDFYVQEQFDLCIRFLRHFFPRSYHKETVSSEDLRGGAELWSEKAENKLVPVTNGVMILAIVAKRLSPEDLWYDGELNQQALIPIPKWNKFCEQYNYKTKFSWESDDDSDDEPIKIN